MGSPSRGPEIHVRILRVCRGSRGDRARVLSRAVLDHAFFTSDHLEQHSLGRVTIFAISCEVRNPSKKCKNGTTRFEAWPRARSTPGLGPPCTDAEQSIAQPVARAAITSL